MDEPTNSRLGISSHVVGELRSEADVVIDGYFEGTAHTTARLIVGELGKVAGDIHAQDVRIEGKVTGDIHACGQLEMGPAGVLLGDIRAAGLTIADGGTFRGQVFMDQDERSVPPDPPPLLGDAEEEEPAVDDIPSLGDDESPPEWDTDEHRQADVRARMTRAYGGELPGGLPSPDLDQLAGDTPPQRSIEQLGIAGDTKARDPLGVGSDE